MVEVCEVIGITVFVLLITLAISALLTAVYDMAYLQPVADTRANDYCKNNGFDQYKSYSRVGILSTNPVGIKCEYAEKYTDLGVRANVQ